MKVHVILMFGFVCAPLPAQIPPLPNGQITATVTPSSGISVGQTVTVTCQIGNYRGTDEIDSVNFDVNYDKSRFAFVNGSFYTGTTSGTNQQWLSMTNQDAAGSDYSLTNTSDSSIPGLVAVTIGDIGANEIERGALSPSGFLISFQLQAVGPGSSVISVSPALDGSVLLDTALQPVGTISLSSFSVVVANSTSIAVESADPSGSEPGIDAPAFLFRRFGPTNAPVIVQLNVGGTAEPGYDYLFIDGPLVIPAGITNVLLVLTIIDDSDIEGDETVTVTLPPSADYDISGTGTATVVIHDDENPPPVVLLTSPANGTIYPQPTNIVLTATASDPNGSVTNVEFYRDGTVKIGADASSPYSFTWTNAPPGTYVITAKATDNLGATADSVPISVVVRGPPGVFIISPTNGASFGASSSITVNASASDPDGAIAFLEVYRNGAVLTATNGGAVSALWSNTVPGTYTLTARASDDRGLLSTSSAVVVTVNAAGLTDTYANRPFLSGFTNYATASSTYFSKETGEPNHANRNGDHSGWVAWTAPASGSASMDTFSSSFDTVLAVYTNSPGTDAVSNLVVVAYNDDADSHTVLSLVSFTAVAGKTYAIAVDAYAAGQGGTIHLHISQANPAPVITASPQSQVVSVGDNVTFSVSASGSGTLTNQWRWNGAGLSGATASSVTRTNVAVTNAGLYDVVVSNSGGSVTSAPAVLVVRAPADFAATPSAQVVDAGGTATFSVTATGSDPLNFQWSFKGVLMPGEVTNSYTRYNAQYADGGTYQVTVANAAGSATAGAELIVRPLFTSLIPTNGTLLLNWYGTTGKVYVIEGTTNIALPNTNWTTLGSVTNTALQGQFQVSLTNPPARVLRLRVAP